MKLIKHLLKAKALLLFAVLYTAILTYGSLANSQDLPSVSLKTSDKALHFIGYFVFFIFWFFYLFIRNKTTLKNIFLKIFIAGTLFGIIIEILQTVVTTSRQADIYDIIANCFGLFIAALLLYVFRKKLILLKTNFSL